MAQENERQKRAGLPDSITIGVRDRTRPSSVWGERKVEDVALETARWKKQHRERVKRGFEWTLGTAYRDEERTPVRVARRTISGDERYLA